MIHVLFLTAEPTDLGRLRLGEEFREIQEKILLSKYRDDFFLYQRSSARISDISQALLDTEPEIVHFSGHGLSNGDICFEDKDGKSYPISPKSLANLFNQFSGVTKCVILNSCFSLFQAQSINKYVPIVIGSSQLVTEKSAIAFSIGFYQALGAGKSFSRAFEFGKSQVLIQNSIDSDKYQFLQNTKNQFEEISEMEVIKMDNQLVNNTGKIKIERIEERIHVSFQDITGSYVVRVELPSNIAVKRLLPVLLAKLEIRISYERYNLINKSTGHLLNPELTLIENSVIENDQLMIIAEITSA